MHVTKIFNKKICNHRPNVGQSNTVSLNLKLPNYEIGFLISTSSDKMCQNYI